MTKTTETAPERLWRLYVPDFGRCYYEPDYVRIPQGAMEYVRADLVLSTALAREAAKHLTSWLDMDFCECEGPGHSCGRTQVERCRDKLLASAERAEESDVAWRPIETAPTDGSEVLGSCGGRVFQMYLGPFGEWLDEKDRVFRPLYWMPLPPPPEASK